MSLSPDSTGVINFAARKLTRRLSDNLALFNDILEGDDTFRVRALENRFDPSIHCAVLFIDGMVNVRVINENIVEPVIETELRGNVDLLTRIGARIISGNEVAQTSDLKKIVESMLYGDTVVLADNADEALIVNTKGFNFRNVSEPDDDKALLGPREGFTEAVLINLSLIRRKILTPDLKFKFRTFGTRTNTKACLCYLESLVNRDVLENLERRLDGIVTDGVLDVNYLAEHIKDARWGFFKTIGATEKPDIVAAKLLEGRVAVLLDGTPVVLTVPYLFIENLQSPDDYYLNFLYGTFVRTIRLIGFLITTSVPAIYIALLGFHQEMIPSNLMLSIAASAKGVPFPTLVETFGMLLIFDMLRETGLRMSNKIGQALSIVGALVVGQAAVEAKFVSAPTVIVVALTGITGLMLPRLKGSILFVRLVFFLLSSAVGLYGYFFGMIALLLYLLSMHSFGVEYMSQMFPTSPKHLSDTFARAPFWKQRRRPLGLSNDLYRSGKS